MCGGHNGGDLSQWHLVRPVWIHWSIGSRTIAAGPKKEYCTLYCSYCGLLSHTCSSELMVQAHKGSSPVHIPPWDRYTLPAMGILEHPHELL